MLLICSVVLEIILLTHVGNPLSISCFLLHCLLFVFCFCLNFQPFLSLSFSLYSSSCAFGFHRKHLCTHASISMKQSNHNLCSHKQTCSWSTWRTQTWSYYNSNQNTFAHTPYMQRHIVGIKSSTFCSHSGETHLHTESTANIFSALSSCFYMLSKSNAIIYVTLHSLIHHVTQPAIASKLLPDPFSISTLLLTKQKSSPTLKLALRPQLT